MLKSELAELATFQIANCRHFRKHESTKLCWCKMNAVLGYKFGFSSGYHEFAAIISFANVTQLACTFHKRCDSQKKIDLGTR